MTIVGFGVSRERILDAAVNRIAADGIDAVRIARIAMDAGVSTALVHYHFATREALLAEALEHSFERAGQNRQGESGEGLRDMIDQCLPLPGEQERDWVLWVELWLRAVRHPELRPTAAKLYARMHEWFSEAIEEAMANGDLDADPGAVADRVLALIDGFGVRALLGDPAMPLERAREEVWARPCVRADPTVGFLNGGSENSMSPRPSTAHVRKPAILTAAAEVISERGVQHTRIRDVAERAGTSAPGVLYWFPSKDALLVEALTFSDDRFYDTLTHELEGLAGASRAALAAGRAVAVGRPRRDGAVDGVVGARPARPGGGSDARAAGRPLARRAGGRDPRRTGERRVRIRRRRRPGAPAGSGDGWVRDPARAGRSRRDDGRRAAALPATGDEGSGA